MNILDKLKNSVLIYDGAMGTMLQENGLQSGICPEEWNLSNPDKILKVHRAYIDAGADIIETNTFGGNRLALKKYELDKKFHEINFKGVELAKKTGAFVAASVGPLPEMVYPLGKLTFDSAFEIFREQITALASAKPDLILFETFSDIKELKIAVIAAREVCNIPIQAQMTYADYGTTISGTTPEVSVAVLEGLGVDIIGVNCSLGPRELIPVIKKLSGKLKSGTYLSVLPNAGLPEIKDGRAYFRATPKKLAGFAKRFVKLGVNLLGGCCGTRPEHIKAIADAVRGVRPVKRNIRKTYLTAASRMKTVEMIPKKTPYIIGERINPSRRKILQEELSQGKTGTVRRDAQEQEKNGADLLDINVSSPGINEIEMMANAVNAVQNTVSVPLVIDSPNPAVLEAGLKACTGKPVVNSVNAEKDKLKTILPLVKKYGAAVIALTMDESGIPMTVEERIQIAKKIISEAKRYGIKPEDIIFDFLTLSIAAQPASAKITLDAVRKSKKGGWQTLLGVSNVSFGLPDRKEINSTFLSMAKKCGLTAAIINPIGLKIKEHKGAKKMLLSKKPIVIKQKEKQGIKKTKSAQEKRPLKDLLYECVLSGDKDSIGGYIEKAIKEESDPFKINHDILIPALSEVGKRFENREYFLPQLLLSAEAMQTAIDILQKSFPKGFGGEKAKILMAAVKGDLHDIGKNIVGSVLKNYGYTIIDLGKNSSSDRILKAAKEMRVDIIGLSALMTTTMGQMQIIINELKEHGLDIPVIIGGAVVTKQYAEKIGAFGYAKDAVSAVDEVKKAVKHMAGKNGGW